MNLNFMSVVVEYLVDQLLLISRDSSKSVIFNLSSPAEVFCDHFAIKTGLV